MSSAKASASSKSLPCAEKMTSALRAAKSRPSRRVAGLEDHRVALGAARQGRARRRRRTAGPLAADRRDGAGRRPRRGVGRAGDGVVGPAVPDRAGHGEELLGARVAVGVVEVAAAAEVLPGPGVVGGHHVPAGAAARTAGRGRPSRRARSAGLVVGGVRGGDQPDPVGDGGQRGELGDRVGRPAMSRSWTWPSTSRSRSPSPRKKASNRPRSAVWATCAERLAGVDLRAAVGLGPDRPVVDALEEDPEVQLGVGPGDVEGIGAGHRVSSRRGPPRWRSGWRAAPGRAWVRRDGAGQRAGGVPPFEAGAAARGGTAPAGPRRARADAAARRRRRRRSSRQQRGPVRRRSRCGAAGRDRARARAVRGRRRVPRPWRRACRGRPRSRRRPGVCRRRRRPSATAATSRPVTRATSSCPAGTRPGRPNTTTCPCGGRGTIAGPFTV